MRTNILEEFNCIKSLGNDEFTFLHETDGLYDLENALKEGHRLKVDLAIKRFKVLMHKLAAQEHYKNAFNGKFEYLANDFINTIIPCTWKGNWHRAFETQSPTKKEEYLIDLAEVTYHTMTKKRLYELYEPDSWAPSYKPFTMMYYGYLDSLTSVESFLQEVRSFTQSLLEEVNRDDKYRYMLMDQGMPCNCLDAYARYYNKVKTIIIDRDPRDLYVCNKAIWGSRYIPVGDVDTFITWYSLSRKGVKNQNYRADQVLFMSFESLIFEYESSLQKIRNFIGLEDNEHILKGKYFIPNLSARNTMVYTQYPSLAKDIDKITIELQEYCYPFPQHLITLPVMKEPYIIQNTIDTIDKIQTGEAFPPLPWYLLCSISFQMSQTYKYMQRARDSTRIKKLKAIIRSFLYLPLLPIQFIKSLITIILLSSRVEHGK